VTLIALTAGERRVRLDLADPDDHISRRIIRRQDWYERDLLEDIKTRVRRGTAVDVGAHIGNHTVWMAAACGLPVVALEPNPATRAQLERNVAVNGLTEQVRVIAVAAGHAPSRARVESADPGNTGMSRAVEDPDGEIDVVTIDSLGLVDVAVIKVDVEGAEMSILRGAEETIRRCRPVLYVEAVDTLADVEAFLLPLGYVRFGRYAITPTYGFAMPEAKSVSVAIMAHRKREAFVPGLMAALDRPADVVWDRRDDRWDTGRRAMLSFDPSATHHAVIQDDAIVCRDLIAGIERALEHVPPGTPLCLYAGRLRPFREAVQRLVDRTREDTSWLAMGQMHWGVGIVMPTELIKDAIAWGDGRPDIPNYDWRLSCWLGLQGIPVWYPWPSLVDHRDSPSLVPGRVGARHAHRFVGADASALDLRWDGGVVSIPELSRAQRPSRRSRAAAR